MALNSVFVNHHWAELTPHGRNGMRGHYRRLRTIGLDRHTARMLAAEALWGLSMAKYWTASV
jgi:hypothetical protein